MRLAELLAFAACWLGAAAGLAHGVHDLRGEARVDAERLVIDFESHDGEDCLRLLNELQLRSEDGTRLVGTERSDPADGSCRLEYRLPARAGLLSLHLQHDRRGPARNERLVLAPIRNGVALPETWVLTSRGNRIELPTPRPPD